MDSNRALAAAVALLAVTVSCSGSSEPPAPTKLAFVAQPSNASGGGANPTAIQVAVQDASSNPTTSTAEVTLALGANPGAATLFGTLTATAVNGVALFSDVRVDRPGSGYTLVATSPILTAATSSTFDVTLVFAMVSAGGSFLATQSSGHSCGVTTAGVGYCWGANSFSQLGNNSMTDETRPVMVAGGLTFSSISAGGHHSCGLTTANNVWCWGRNDHGQLGDGTTLPRTFLTQVSTQQYTSVTAGDLHTCAVTNTGDAHCWGLNSSGQLGDETTSSPQATPVRVFGTQSWTSLSADSSHTCGIAANAAWCWGSDDGGKLGNGPGGASLVPAAVAGGISFSELALGVGHSCGLSTNGSAFCWGHGGNSQIGDGNTSSRSTPTAVSAGPVRAIGAGWYHNCAATTSNLALCWGLNDSGQLGDGSLTDRSSPVVVGATLSFNRIDGGRYHSCGITAAGAVYCWGNNNFGQLGDGTTTARPAPTRIIQ